MLRSLAARVAAAVCVSASLGLGGLRSPALADYGKPADVRDARTASLLTWTAFGAHLDDIEKAVTVSDVTISGGYALCSFAAGPSGGQMLLQSQRGRWVKLSQTGGVMSIVDLKGAMPAGNAVELATHNAVTHRNDPFLLGRS